jgi:hypothetical protein
MKNKFSVEHHHPSITEDNTYTKAELASAEVRQQIEAIKRRIANAAGDATVPLLWAALHEIAFELLFLDKGEKYADRYVAALEEYTRWAFQQPLEGSR